MAQVSLALSYPEPFRVTGPLPSLVLRAEDMWQKYKPFCRRSVRGFSALVFLNEFLMIVLLLFFQKQNLVKFSFSKSMGCSQEPAAGS